MCLNHPDVPEVAGGLCGPCYRAKWKAETNGGRLARCHSDRPAYARGRCEDCHLLWVRARLDDVGFTPERRPIAPTVERPKRVYGVQQRVIEGPPPEICPKCFGRNSLRGDGRWYWECYRCGR
jgi:hypothetical protein